MEGWIFNDPFKKMMTLCPYRIGFYSISDNFTAMMVEMVQEMFTLSVRFGLYGCQGTTGFSDTKPPPRTLLVFSLPMVQPTWNFTKAAMRFLHPPDIEPTHPPDFFRVIINGEEVYGSASFILVDGSWHRGNRNAG